MDFPIDLYYQIEPTNINILDRCRGEDDFRKVYLTDDGSRKLAIKHTSNSFTNEKYINGWFRLAKAYNELGIYCPSPINNKNGELIHHYQENNRSYYVYAEELAKYPTAESIGEEKFTAADGQPIFLKNMMRSLGRVANAKLDVISFHSAYCLLEPYAPPDITDETTECALRFVNYLRKEIPIFHSEADELWNLFVHAQNELKKNYSSLPTSCFQADLNLSNILLNDENDFAGLIDFNLCGREPSLNYLVREALWWADGKELYDSDTNPLYCYDHALDTRKMSYFLKNLTYIQEEYEYSLEERHIFPILFRYINSFWWGDLKELKRIKDDPDKVSALLGYIKQQMTRNDILLP